MSWAKAARWPPPGQATGRPKKDPLRRPWIGITSRSAVAVRLFSPRVPEVDPLGAAGNGSTGRRGDLPSSAGRGSQHVFIAANFGPMRAARRLCLATRVRHGRGGDVRLRRPPGGAAPHPRGAGQARLGPGSPASRGGCRGHAEGAPSLPSGRPGGPGHVPQCTRAHGMVLTPIGEVPEQGFCVSGCFRRRVAEETLAA